MLASACDVTAPPDDETPELQREVQRLLGRCILRLQQYEGLMKALIADHVVSGAAVDLQRIRDRQVKDTARKTLGKLMGELLGSYLVAGEPDSAEDLVTDAPEVSFRMRLSLSEDDFARTETGLRELVELRNNLVHQFIDQHDINRPDGCRGASTALIAAYERIDHHFEELREWARDLLRMRERMAAAMAPGMPFYMALVHGIHPDGTIDWQIASIVEALRKAATDLQVDGWARVAEAGAWVAAHHPDLSPQAYGCRSWRQVLHESRAFDLRYLEKDGQRAAWYRAKTVSSKAH